MDRSAIPPSRRGIMRTEVIVVVCLLVLLVCVAVPLVSRARTNSDRTLAKDRLRNLGHQIQIYHDQHRRFPIVPGPTRSPDRSPDTPSLNGTSP
jgi:type II secretory pathway pseudopilin PulG